MKINDELLLQANSRGQLRQWLEQNSTTEKACWVIVSVKEQENTVMYLDAVEEALCFGWIDGTKKKIDEDRLAQRLSPRRKTSSWTELNKERVRRLERLGLMTEHGRKVLPDMEINNFKIDDDILRIINSDKVLCENFNNLNDIYKRIRIDTIQSYKHDRELFEKRLEKFIENTKQNKMYGQWHDNGKLFSEDKK